MPHLLETAPSGRAKCRACKLAIGKGELRLGVAVPNAFGEGDALHWFHLECGAERRSAEFLEAWGLSPDIVPPEMAEHLRKLASLGLAHPRWTRPARVERATTGRAKCRHCREAIAAGSLRIQLEFVEDGMINPAGFLHPTCAKAYLGTTELLLGRLRRTSQLDESELSELTAAFLVEGIPPGQAEAEESEK